MNFYDRIIEVANMGVVTAADFAPFIGRENWLVIDAEDLPGYTKGDLTAELDAVCAFKVHKVDFSGNHVAILAKIHDLVPDGTLMWFSADELAIRMEAA